ncbi:MAG: pyrroloquinoline quinone biosynthesis protein PqqE [Pikeienuella sp.]
MSAGVAEDRERAARPAAPPVRPPMALLAELTYRCPLACPYCSNPIEMAQRDAELPREIWRRVFAEAAELGVLHVHLSGGEPAARRDLEALVADARAQDLYTNLITSGIGLTERRLDAMQDAGLDHVQLSLQGVDAATADLIGGYKGGYARKMQVAQWVRARDLPLTLNAVMHKRNLDRLEETIALAVEMGARRIEVATVQFHGWAERNRAALMPTREQAKAAGRIVADARVRLKGTLVIDYVPADHHADYPKPCMGGWGAIGLNVTPDGRVMPCHAAHTIPDLDFPRVTELPLREIWYHSQAFNAFRGFDWMQEPCRSCDRRGIDFGGCRCQAMAVTGDARATDPVCIKSPHHAALASAAEADAHASGEVSFVYRESP